MRWEKEIQRVQSVLGPAVRDLEAQPGIPRGALLYVLGDLLENLLEAEIRDEEQREEQREERRGRARPD